MKNDQKAVWLLAVMLASSYIIPLKQYKCPSMDADTIERFSAKIATVDKNYLLHTHTQMSVSFTATTPDRA
jgi:hypothetical protein